MRFGRCRVVVLDEARKKPDKEKGDKDDQEFNCEVLDKEGEVWLCPLLWSKPRGVATE